MRLLKDYRLLTILLIPYLKPLCISDLWVGSAIDVFWNVCRILSCVLILLIWVGGYRKIGRLTIVYGIYSLYTIVALFHTDPAAITSALLREVSMLSLLLLIEMAYSVSERAVVRALYTIVSAYLIIQILLLVVFPNGFNNGTNESRVHFLGLDNEFTLFAVLTFTISQVYMYLYPRKKTRANVISVLAIAVCFFLASGAGIAIALVLTAYFFVRDKSWRILNVMNAFIAVNALYLMLVVFNLSNVFSWLIVNVLRKTTTFTSRIYIWQSALLTIVSHPLWGTGKSIVHVSGWMSLYYAHNLYLDIGMRYGAIAIVLFLVFLFVVCKRCGRVTASRQNALFTISIFALLLSGLAEGAEYRVELFVVLAVLFHHSTLLLRYAPEAPAVKA